MQEKSDESDSCVSDNPLIRLCFGVGSVNIVGGDIQQSVISHLQLNKLLAVYREFAIYTISVLILLIGVATFLFGGVAKWQSSLLLLVSIIPIFSTSIYWYVVNNLTQKTMFPAVLYSEWTFIIASHIVLIASFLVNRKSKKRQWAFSIFSILVLVFMYLPIYEFHDGWGYHGHNIWGLSLHLH